MREISFFGIMFKVPIIYVKLNVSKEIYSLKIELFKNKILGFNTIVALVEIIHISFSFLLSLLPLAPFMVLARLICTISCAMCTVPFRVFTRPVFLYLPAIRFFIVGNPHRWVMYVIIFFFTSSWIRIVVNLSFH